MRIRGFAHSTPCWVELTTPDPARAADFYTELFGWQLDGDRFMLNGHAVAGLRRSQADLPDGWLSYLATSDLEATSRQVVVAGGQRLTWPSDRDGGRTAIVTDTAGAAFGLWQATGFTGAQLRGEPGTMAWPDLLTDDVATATAFYGSVFGWTLTHEFGSGEWLTEAHDSVAGLATGRYGARWRAAFEVAHCGEAITRCARSGGRVTSGPVELGLSMYAEFLDPFGAVFAVAAPANRPVELSVGYNEIIGMELTYGG